MAQLAVAAKRAPLKLILILQGNGAFGRRFLLFLLKAAVANDLGDLTAALAEEKSIYCKGWDI
jgi:hypothetical protein